MVSFENAGKAVQEDWSIETYRLEPAESRRIGLGTDSRTSSIIPSVDRAYPFAVLGEGTVVGKAGQPTYGHELVGGKDPGIEHLGSRYLLRPSFS